MILYTIASIIYFIVATIMQAHASEAGLLWVVFGMLLIYKDFMKKVYNL